MVLTQGQDADPTEVTLENPDAVPKKNEHNMLLLTKCNCQPFTQSTLLDAQILVGRSSVLSPQGPQL